MKPTAQGWSVAELLPWSRKHANERRQDPPRRPEPNNEEEHILRAATLHLIQKHGMFLVATGARAARIKGFRVWIITVALRYATGNEGYIGELLYDGEQFTFLTEASVIDERARKMAADPEGLREWIGI
jgi:hypothetical protein